MFSGTGDYFFLFCCSVFFGSCFAVLFFLLAECTHARVLLKCAACFARKQ